MLRYGLVAAPGRRRSRRVQRGCAFSRQTGEAHRLHSARRAPPLSQLDPLCAVDTQRSCFSARVRRTRAMLRTLTRGCAAPGGSAGAAKLWPFLACVSACCKHLEAPSVRSGRCVRMHLCSTACHCLATACGGHATPQHRVRRPAAHFPVFRVLRRTGHSQGGAAAGAPQRHPRTGPGTNSAMSCALFFCRAPAAALYRRHGLWAPPQHFSSA